MNINAFKFDINPRRKRGERQTVEVIEAKKNNTESTYAKFTFDTETAAELMGKRYSFDFSVPDVIAFQQTPHGYKFSKDSNCVAILLKEEDTQIFREKWFGNAYKLETANDSAGNPFYYIENKTPCEQQSLADLFADEPEPPKLPEGVTLREPTDPSEIKEPDVVKVLNYMKEHGCVSLVDCTKMKLSDKRYKKAMTSLLNYGYTTLAVPCVNKNGSKFFVTMLYNGSGRFDG